MITAHCHFVACRHEPYRPTWGEPESAKDMITELDSRADPGWLLGHSSHLILGVLAPIFAAIPDIRVVCLHRPKSETVKSYMKFLGGNAQSWVAGKQSEAARCYPAYTFDDPRRDAEIVFGLWWETAEHIMSNVKKQIPEEQVLHMQMRHLSDEESLRDMCKFLGIPPRQIRFPDKLEWCRRRDGRRILVS
jgi:hypothetical protein